MNAKPAPSASLVEDVTARLRERIISGEMTPRTRLSEQKLAADLEVSRNTLREVFRLLTHEGLLRHEPNRGVFVASPSMASILDIYRVRKLIEIPVLRQAWCRHPAIDGMRQAVAEGTHRRQARDWLGVGSANMSFHKAIVALSDSERLISFFSQITAELRLAFGLVESAELLHSPYIERNAEILNLLEADKAAEASRILDLYLDDSERVLLNAFAKLQ